MAVRIHQLLAIIGGLTTETNGVIARLTHIAGQEDLFTGVEKNYRLIAEQLPGASRRVVTPQSVKRVRVTAATVLADAEKLLTRKWDTALTLDTAQGSAKASVVVGGVTVLDDVPVKHLVYLEGELAVLHGIVAALPVLDGVQDWTDENTEPGQWRSARPLTGTKDAKVMFNWHRGNGTPTIQEQVDVHTRDEPVEEVTTVNFSGALPPKRKAQLLERLSDLRTAVKMAREEANSATVTQRDEGAALFNWLLAL